MIDYVAPGQKIQAGTINQLIGQANYVGQPSPDQQYTTNPDGSVTYGQLPSDAGGSWPAIDDGPRLLQARLCVLSAKYGSESGTQDKAAQPRWAFFIGSVSNLLSNIQGPFGSIPDKFNTVPLSGITTDGLVLVQNQAFASGNRKITDSDLSNGGWLQTDDNWPDLSAYHLHQFVEDAQISAISGGGPEASSTISAMHYGYALMATGDSSFASEVVKKALKWENNALTIGKVQIGHTAVTGSKEDKNQVSTLVQTGFPPYGQAKVDQRVDSDLCGVVGSLSWIHDDKGDSYAQIRGWNEPYVTNCWCGVKDEYKRDYYYGDNVAAEMPLGIEYGAKYDEFWIGDFLVAKGSINSGKEDRVMYLQQYVQFPTPPQADNVNKYARLRPSGQQSLDMCYTDSGKYAFFQLHDFDQDNASEPVISLDWGKSYSIAAGDILQRYQGNLLYTKPMIVMPEKPEGKNYDVQIGNINIQITNLCQEIWVLSNEISAQKKRIEKVEDRISELSGNYWEQGGGSDTCYGESIGDSDAKMAISLNGRVLYDRQGIGVLEFSSETVKVAYLSATANVDTPSIRATDLVNFRNAYTELGQTFVYGNFYIGDTLLTEADLKKLLALVQ